MGFFSKIKEGLKKTRDAVIGQIDNMLCSATVIDEDLFDELDYEVMEAVKKMRLYNVIDAKNDSIADYVDRDRNIAENDNHFLNTKSLTQLIVRNLLKIHLFFVKNFLFFSK